MKKHFAKLLLLGAMIVAGFSFVGCNDIEKELADLNNKVENLESESAKNLQDAINALNAKLASDYALKTDVSALEIALKGTIAEQVAVAEAKINKAIEDAIAACKAESADAIAKVSADLAKVSEELTAVAGDVKAATAKIDENAAAIAGVDAKVLELKGTIDALADYLDTLEGMARENKATLDSFAEYFAEYKGDVDMKLTELHGSLAALSVYLEELEASIDARFAEHQNTFLALSAFLEEHEIEVDAKFKEILGTFDALAAHLEEREAKIDFALEEINGTFAALSPVIETMQAQIKETHNTLEALADYLDEKEAETQLALEQLNGQLEALSPVVAEMQAKINANSKAVADLKALLEKANYQGQIDLLKAEVEANVALLEAIEAADYQKQIDALKDQLEALSEGQVDVDAVKAEVEAVVNGIVEELTGRVATLENRLQSVSYVPEYFNGPVAVKFAADSENKDIENGYVHMSFEVAPKAYATKLTAENTTLVGVGLTKAVEVEQFDVQILDANAVTGIVEVIGYIDTKSAVWNKDAAALALRVMAEDAQVTSAYTNVTILKGSDVTINSAIKFGRFDENGEFVEAKDADFVYSMPYDTPVADSEVALFEGLQPVVSVAGFFDALTPAEAAEILDLKIDVQTQLSKYATKFFVTTNENAYDLVEDEEGELDTPAFVVADDQTLDITVKFNEVVVDSLAKTEAGLIEYKKAPATTVALKEGFYLVNGKNAANFAGLTAKYQVAGLTDEIKLDLDDTDVKAIEWSAENYNKTTWTYKDVDVTGGNGRELLLTGNHTMWLLDEEGNKVTSATDAPTVTVKFISIDNADVTVTNVKWPEEDTVYTYAYETTVTDTDTDTQTTISFDLNVTVKAGQPNIGEVPVANGVTVTLAYNNEYLNDAAAATAYTSVPLTGIVEALLPYYKDYFKTEAEAKAAIKTAINGREVSVAIANDKGELKAPVTNITKKLKYHYSHTTGLAESSFIQIPYDVALYNEMSEAYVRFSFTASIFGIESTITADCAKVSKWQAGSFATAKVIAGRLSPEFDGKQTFVLGSKNATVMKKENGKDVVDYSYSYAVAPTTQPSTYEFNKNKTFTFGDYVDFDIHKDDSNVYYVVWQIKPQSGVTHLATGVEANPYTINSVLPYVESPEGTALNEDFYYDTAKKSVQNKSRATATDVKDWWGPLQITGSGNTRARFDAFKLIWNNSEINSYKIDFKLVTKNDQGKFVDVANSAKSITFSTDRAISSVTASDVVINWSNDYSLMTDNVMTGVTVKDLFNTVINNQAADVTYSTFWSGYVLDKTATEDAVNNPAHNVIYKTDATVFGSANVYGQDINIIEFDIDDISNTTTLGYIKAPKGYVMGTTTIDSNGNVTAYTGDYSFDNTTGAFYFHPNTKPSGDVEFTVYVEVTHDNSYGQTGLKQPVKIKIDVE